MSEVPLYRASGFSWVWAILIDFDAVMMGKELQSSGKNFMDRTLNTPNLLIKPHVWSCPTPGTKFVPGLGVLSP